MANELLIKLHETTEGFLEAISLFTQEQFNIIPFEGSWTAAQVTEHIFKAEVGIPQIWQGNAKPTERAVDQNVPMISKIFLDFENKMKSPEFIVPSPAGVIQDREERYQAMEKNRTEIEKLAAGIDLSLTYTDFALPNMGALTGQEWVVFLTVHSFRHMHQLRNIHKALG